MRLITFLIFAFVLVMFMLVSTANAVDVPVELTLKTTQVAPYDDIIKVLGFITNDDGTQSYLVLACGTKVEIRGKKDELRKHMRDLNRIMEEEIDRLCGL